MDTLDQEREAPGSRQGGWHCRGALKPGPGHPEETVGAVRDYCLWGACQGRKGEVGTVAEGTA